MTTYRVDGFNRQNHAQRVTILLDRENPNDPLESMRKAEAIAGPRFCFHMSQNLNSPFPMTARGSSSKATKSSTRVFPN